MQISEARSEIGLSRLLVTAYDSPSAAWRISVARPPLMSLTLPLPRLLQPPFLGDLTFLLRLHLPNLIDDAFLWKLCELCHQMQVGLRTTRD